MEKVAVHWDKWKKQWRCYEGLTFSLMDDIYLEDVFFFVQPEGRDKVREAHTLGSTKFDARFPHAYAFGNLLNHAPQGKWIPFNYNPFTDDFFMRLDINRPIINAKFAHFDPSGKGSAIFPRDSSLLHI